MKTTTIGCLKKGDYFKFEENVYRVGSLISNTNGYVACTNVITKKVSRLYIDTTVEYHEIGEKQSTPVKLVKPTLIKNLGKYTEQHQCECGHTFNVHYHPVFENNNDAPLFCKQCGCRFIWSEEQLTKDELINVKLTCKQIKWIHTALHHQWHGMTDDNGDAVNCLQENANGTYDTLKLFEQLLKDYGKE
jgi:hypothetical protein